MFHPRPSAWGTSALLAACALVAAFATPQRVLAAAGPAPVENPFFAGPSLQADVASLSLEQGGTQRMVLNAGPAYAGREYQIVGSASGTFPGTAYDAINVPLNYDHYSEKLLEVYRKAPCFSFSGRLDAKGRAYPFIRLDGKNQLKLRTGKVYYHGAIIWNADKTRIDAASNATEVLILP